MAASTTRTAVYRGSTREQAERAYHADARQSAIDGYVPASEDWSVALGQQVLTVGYVYAPEQVPDVLAALASPTRAPAPSTPPSPTDAPTPASSTGRPRVSRGLIIGLVVVALLIVGVWQAGLLSRLTSQGGTVGNIPPAGEIWFGTSFDPSTFAVNSRTSSIRVGGNAAMVAQLPRAVGSGDMNLRLSLDGTVILNQNVVMQGGGELFGSTVGPFTLAGTYLYELTDLGGNVLARGSLTVSP